MNSAHRARLRTFHASSTTRPKCRIPCRRGFTSSSIRRQQLEDYYKVMGLGPEATDHQIKTRYYSLSKLYHPDLNPNKETHSKFHQLQNAYAVLGSTHERRDYDRKRAGIRTNTSQRTSTHSQGTESPFPGGSGMRAKRRTAAWSNTRQHPLEMGFAPRSSWHPEFRRFYDDWAVKMKQSGLDPEKTSLGYDARNPNPALLEQMMNGDLLAQYVRKMRAEGKDPLSQIFMSATGRNSNAGQWLKNRMAMLDREEMTRSGGAWERGGPKRRDTSTKGFPRSWGTGPKPAYSSEGPSPAEKLGGKGTGEETFNSPWDEPPLRGFQHEVPRPSWAGASQPAYDTWKPESSSTSFATAAKRDYSKGHELDARHEEDKLKMVQRERRWRGGMILVGATSAIIAGWTALTTWF